MQWAVTAIFNKTLKVLQQRHVTVHRVKFFENVSVLAIREPERQSVPSLHTVKILPITGHCGPDGE